MKNFIQLLIIGIAGIGFWVLVEITNYNKRMDEYNYHVCVEVYGLDENCNKK